jgi:hypothetical protein
MNPFVAMGVNSQQEGAYQVTVSNSVGSITSDLAVVSVLVPPTIILDITNESVAVGANFSFQVGASGSALGYQWLFNGASLAGATSNVLYLSHITLAQAGSYQVIVSNAAGTATSALANLSVSAAPTLSIVSLNGTSFKLSFSGTPLQNYELETCATLDGTWRVLGTVTADSSGMAQYITSADLSAGFFRVVVQ